MLRTVLFPILFLSVSLFAEAGSKVVLDETGNTLIDGKPFFPIGIFSYSPDTSALDDMRKHAFNTIVAATEHHKPEQMDLMASYGLRIVCPVRDEWIEPAKKHPATLAWYLADEPEGHGETPQSLREKYLQLKQKDPNHPITVDHFLLDSLASYKDAEDVTMTSYYPLTAVAAPPLANLSHFFLTSRAIHGTNWPHWPFIQVFGGTNTDGGKWKQPEPDEVRALVYISLVQRAQGIFYFSYWPQAPKTWNEVGILNREIQRMTPWLVAKGNELPAASTNAAVHVRVKNLEKSSGGLLLAINTVGWEVQTEIAVPGFPKKKLQGLFGQRTSAVAKGKFAEKFRPFESRVYVWGEEPKIQLAGPIKK